MLAETYLELLTDPNHILFELTLMAFFDGFIGLLAYPLFKKWLKAHDLKHHGHECK